MRVLILANETKRAGLISQLAGKAGFACAAFRSAADLCSAFDESAGACVLMEEVLSDPESCAVIEAALERQPSWSDLPIVVIARSKLRSDSSGTVIRDVGSLGNAWIIRRPLRSSLGNALQVAFRDRRRQLELRSAQEPKQSEQHLSASEERLRHALDQRRLALDAANLGTWNYDLETGKVVSDERTQRIFGATGQDSLEHEDAIARIHPDDRAGVDEAVQRALAGVNQGAYDHEFRVVWPDGSVHWVAGHGRVFFEHSNSDQPRAVRFAGVTMEITDRRLAEERLRQAQKLESIGLLAGGVAHDFNNLFTVIIGNASAALDRCSNCEHHRAVLSAAERAADLTKQLVAYAGTSESVKKEVDLNELVSNSKQLLASSVPKRVRLGFSLAKELPLVEEDPSRVEQILMNLVINAGEACTSKVDAVIDIATGITQVTPEAAARQSRYSVAPGTYVWLEVRDNGEGMDDTAMSRIFDPFFSTKFTGRGLGLAAVDGIVRSSSGFIEVFSTSGSGATFRVHLPASSNSQAGEADATGEPRSSQSPSTVLVVDDEALVRRLAGMILRHHGFDVLEAADGKHALQILAETRSLPSVVLLDLAMPVMGGDELIPILHKQYPSVKILISSGYTEQEAQAGLRDAPIAGFLQKPYTATTLTNIIHEILGEVNPQRGQLVQFPKYRDVHQE